MISPKNALSGLDYKLLPPVMGLRLWIMSVCVGVYQDSCDTRAYRQCFGMHHHLTVLRSNLDLRHSFARIPVTPFWFEHQLNQCELSSHFPSHTSVFLAYCLYYTIIFRLASLYWVCIAKPNSTVLLFTDTFPSFNDNSKYSLRRSYEVTET
jgi:hypothetical protein